MAESQIKWNKQDAMRLEKAVNDFNSKIKKLEKQENKLYLPDKINFNKLKENITTRTELNKKIESLKRFQKEGAEDLYITKAGQKLTKWERQELSRLANTAKRRLNKELEKLSTPKAGQKYSRVQMGSARARAIESQLENLDKIETTEKGYKFKMRKEMINIAGASDYNMKRSMIYRENYIKEMEKYENFENYDKLKAWMEKNKNPVTFYDKMSVTEFTKDLTYQSDQALTQEEFNRFLIELGIDIEDDTILTYDQEQRRILNELDVAEYNKKKEV